MRGRLIFPLDCDIAPLDAVTTSSGGGYDDDFRETTLVDSDGDGLGESQRKEGATRTLKAQLETDRTELQRMTGTGDIPDIAIGLVLHMRDLENAGLVDTATGRILAVKKGDRLLEVRNPSDGTVVMKFDGVEERGRAYCVHVNRLMGFTGSYSNLALAMFEERPRGRV